MTGIGVESAKLNQFRFWLGRPTAGGMGPSDWTTGTFVARVGGFAADEPDVLTCVSGTVPNTWKGMATR